MILPPHPGSEIRKLCTTMDTQQKCFLTINFPERRLHTVLGQQNLSWAKSWRIMATENEILR